jgi:hypothetical protein
VLATGLGKTWLAAFDAVRMGARRILFVAHRQEILSQAAADFRAHPPSQRVGYYTGRSRDADVDVLCASVQTLGRAEHLERFAPQHFDYLVVDEFHHAAAPTYRRLLGHFAAGVPAGADGHARPHRPVRHPVAVRRQPGLHAATCSRASKPACWRRSTTTASWTNRSTTARCPGATAASTRSSCRTSWPRWRALAMPSEGVARSCPATHAGLLRVDAPRRLHGRSVSARPA